MGDETVKRPRLDDIEWIEDLDRVMKKPVDTISPPSAALKSDVDFNIRTEFERNETPSVTTFPFTTNYRFEPGQSLDEYLYAKPFNQAEFKKIIDEIKQLPVGQTVPIGYMPTCPVHTDEVLGQLYVGVPWMQMANLNKFLHFESQRLYLYRGANSEVQPFLITYSTSEPTASYNSTVQADGIPSTTYYYSPPPPTAALDKLEFENRFSASVLPFRKAALLNDLLSLVLYLVKDSDINNATDIKKRLDDYIRVAIKFNSGSNEIPIVYGSASYIANQILPLTLATPEVKNPKGEIIQEAKAAEADDTTSTKLFMSRFVRNALELCDYITRYELLAEDTFATERKTYDIYINKVLGKLASLSGSSFQEYGIVNNTNFISASLQSIADRFMATTSDAKPLAELKAEIEKFRVEVITTSKEIRAWTEVAIHQEARTLSKYQAVLEENRAMRKELAELRKGGAKGSGTSNKLKLTGDVRTYLQLQISKYLQTESWLLRLVERIMGNKQSRDYSSILKLNIHGAFLENIIKAQAADSEGNALTPDWWKKIKIQEFINGAEQTWLRESLVALKSDSVAGLIRVAQENLTENYAVATTEVLNYVLRLYEASGSRPIPLEILCQSEQRGIALEIPAYISARVTVAQAAQHLTPMTRYDHEPNAILLLNSQAAIKLRMQELGFNFTGINQRAIF